MVARKNVTQKYALISVFDKTRLNYLCKNLNNNNFRFISTGTTCKKIKSLGYNCIEVSKITNFKEILNGRVKTLNPKIYGSILYKRDNAEHIKDFRKLKVPKIDLVVINLYPFKQFLKDKDREKIVEMIDIGGPSLIRASSKNWKYVTIISSVKDYDKLIFNLKKNKGFTDIDFRKKMAAKGFALTSSYDKLISEWLNPVKKKIKNDLRYGENPNQKSFILNNNSKILFDNQISGKKISYNNVIDVDSGLRCLNEFNEPTCVILKHNNPCGVASSNKIVDAFVKAYDSDSKSAFGGIVLLNRKIDRNFANKLSKYFFEIILAPKFDKFAINILGKKKRLILLNIDKYKIKKYECRSTLFGDLYQDIDRTKINKSFCKLVSHKKISSKMYDDLLFSLKVVKHLKSNAIVLSKNKQTLGLGSGQTNRIDSLLIALKKYKNNFKVKNFVCSSDGFFPFTDSLKILKKNNCRIVAQPSGSINDKKNIVFAKENKISLYFIKNRLFKH